MMLRLLSTAVAASAASARTRMKKATGNAIFLGVAAAYFVLALCYLSLAMFIALNNAIGIIPTCLIMALICVVIGGCVMFARWRWIRHRERQELARNAMLASALAPPAAPLNNALTMSVAALAAGFFAGRK